MSDNNKRESKKYAVNYSVYEPLDPEMPVVAGTYGTDEWEAVTVTRPDGSVWREIRIRIS